jgi:hypothetical protein
LYWIGLGQIEGRPSHALQSIVTTRDMRELGKRLKISQPIRIDPSSPYFFLLQGRDMSVST